jgi:chemotaxis protein CheD
VPHSKKHQERSQDVVLHPGDFYFGGGAARVRTLLGSCVSIVLWHRERRIGGMCHYLLPTRTQPKTHGDALDGHYADEAIALFMREVRGRRTQPSEYIVKLFGGGNMFPNQARQKACRMTECNSALRRGCEDVACKNIQIGRDLLAEQGFVIASEHVGGVGYRQLIFDLGTGDVWLRRGTPLSEQGRTPPSSTRAGSP